MSLTSENGPTMTMPVAPAYGGMGGYGMGGFGGDGWWGILFLIAIMCGGWGGFGGFGGMGGLMGMWPFLFGGFGNGFGGGNAQQGYDTRADLQRGFDNQAVITKLDGITQGICDSTYALNNTVTNGFHGVDNAICNLGSNMQQGFNATQVAMMQGQNAIQTQMANCCCGIEKGQMQIENTVGRGFCDTNYNLSTNTNAIIQNSHNDTDRVIAKLDAMEMARKDETIDALRSQVNALNLAQSQANQTTAIRTSIINELRNCPVGTYQVPNPNCCYGPWGGMNWAGFNGHNNGCNNGCGSCCG